jgi:molybdate transport system regulatory protein
MVGRNIVIAASGRKLGKTLLSTALVKELSAGGFRVACFKLRKREKSGVEYIPGPGREGSDTWRAAEAGAAETGLLNYCPGCSVMDCMPGTSAEFDAVIWETNSAADQIPGAMVVYIDGDVPEPKDPELADRAVVHIAGPLKGEISRETTGLILSTAGFSGFNPVRPGWKLWLELDSGPVFGGGIAHLLEVIRDTGSIIAASRTTGIQYRRVWTLISRTEEKLGVRLIHRSRGGSGGGGSSLTPVAAMLLQRYHYLEDAMRKAAARLEENRE